MRQLHWVAVVCPALVAGALGCSQALGGSESDAPAGDSFGSAGSSSNIGPGASYAGTGSGIGLGTGGSGNPGVPGVAPSDPSPEQEPAAGGQASVPQEPIATNPFVITSHDPLSTFAADVDTASYDIFMSSVSTGSLPPA